MATCAGSTLLLRGQFSAQTASVGDFLTAVAVLHVAYFKKWGKGRAVRSFR